MKLKSSLAVLATSLTALFTATQASAATWNGAFLLNGTGGGWMAVPNTDYRGIFNFYYANGANPNAPIANPNGGINVTLALGEQTFTALCTDGSGSATSQRTLILNFAGWGNDSLTWTSTGPASVTVADKLDPIFRITIKNVTYTDPIQGGTPDRVRVNSVGSDGYRDTVATFTIAYELDPAAALAEITTLRAELAACEAQESGLQAQITSLQNQIATLQGQISSANGTVTAAENELSALGDQLGASQGAVGFVIPGATPAAQLQALNAAINQLPPGQKKALFESMGGKKK